MSRNWHCSEYPCVTDMHLMFFAAANVFKHDLSAWNVSSVTDIHWMFYNSFAFNQDLNAWDVSNVTMMEWMFYAANAFNQDLSAWVKCHKHAKYVFNQKLSVWGRVSAPDVYTSSYTIPRR
eukprot:scaffold296728_cov31-Attheya_sp.AAC.1